MTANELITKQDLLNLKAELLSAMQSLVNQADMTKKKWLKTNEVKEMLGLSSSGLSNLRINGTLPYTKLSGVIYYDYSDIMKILESTKQNSN